ncbi:hypothetical protein AAHY27_27405 (plasmid) [Klebsiella pneumoniae]|nr:hypothetical protein [Klebsiella pneumoniae]
MQNVSGLRLAPDVENFDEIFQAAKIHNSVPTSIRISDGKQKKRLAEASLPLPFFLCVVPGASR